MGVPRGLLGCDPGECLQTCTQLRNGLAPLHARERADLAQVSLNRCQVCAKRCFRHLDQDGWRQVFLESLQQRKSRPCFLLFSLCGLVQEGRSPFEQTCVLARALPFLSA